MPPCANCRCSWSSVSRALFGHRDFPRLFLPELSDLPGLIVVVDHLERIAGSRQSLEAEDLDRNRRAGFFDLISVLVIHRPDFAVHGSDDEVVADPQRPVLDENGCDVTVSSVELGLQHRAHRREVRVGLELPHVRDQQDQLQQSGQIRLLFRRNL